jgi:hypothetical protein
MLNCSSILILLESCLQTCITYTIAECTVNNSWWWTEELSATRRVSFQYKFEKLVYLVGFIIGKRRLEESREEKVSEYSRRSGRDAKRKLPIQMSVELPLEPHLLKSASVIRSVTETKLYDYAAAACEQCNFVYFVICTSTQNIGRQNMRWMKLSSENEPSFFLPFFLSFSLSRFLRIKWLNLHILPKHTVPLLLSNSSLVFLQWWIILACRPFVTPYTIQGQGPIWIKEEHSFGTKE